MSRREKLLLFSFITVIAISISAIGFDQYRKKKAAIHQEYSEMEFQLAEIETLIEEKALWNTRGEWLRATQPQFTSTEEIENAMFQQIKSPTVQNIEISNLQLFKTEKSDHFARTGAKLTASGSLEAVFYWIYSLQQPDKFQAIEDLVVIPDKENDSVINCSFRITRWHALGDR